MSVANGNSNYVSKFQLSSSNGLGVIHVFVTKIDDQKGDRFYHLLVENLAPAEIARVQELSEAKFSKSKKRIENLFFLKLCYLDIKNDFELIELHLFFTKRFWKS